MLGARELFVGDLPITVLVLMVEDLFSDLCGILTLLHLLEGDLLLDVSQHLQYTRKVSR